jgi:hypothetical protein
MPNRRFAPNAFPSPAWERENIIRVNRRASAVELYHAIPVALSGGGYYNQSKLIPAEPARDYQFINPCRWNIIKRL